MNDKLTIHREPHIKKVLEASITELVRKKARVMMLIESRDTEELHITLHNLETEQEMLEMMHRSLVKLDARPEDGD